MWLGDVGLNSVSVQWLTDIKKNGNGASNPGHPLSTIGLSMADSKDLRWTDEYGDELTMAIAIRDWEGSVKLVEKGDSFVDDIGFFAYIHVRSSPLEVHRI